MILVLEFVFVAVVDFEGVERANAVAETIRDVMMTSAARIDELRDINLFPFKLPCLIDNSASSYGAQVVVLVQQNRNRGAAATFGDSKGVDVHIATTKCTLDPMSNLATTIRDAGTYIGVVAPTRTSVTRE